MGDTTGITWTDHTRNKFWGCTMITDACTNCYASAWSKFTRNALFPKGYVKGSNRVLIKSATLGQLQKWDKQAAAEGRKGKVFANSMSDIFDMEVPDEWRIEEFEWFSQQKNLYFQVLTKRSGYPEKYYQNHPYDPSNIWLGTSLGSDKDLHMAHEIVKAPALLHWISYEPAIGPLSVYELPPEIKWLVIGGESGHGARPFNIEWALETVEACKDLRIKVFVKQLGLHPQLNGKPYLVSDSHGKILSEWPEALRIQEFPL